MILKYKMYECHDTDRELKRQIIKYDHYMTVDDTITLKYTEDRKDLYKNHYKDYLDYVIFFEIKYICNHFYYRNNSCYIISKLYTNTYYVILFWDGMMNKIISLNHLREIFAKLNVHTNYIGKFDNDVIRFLIYNTMNTSSNDIQFIGYLIKLIEKIKRSKMNLDNNIKKYKTHEIMINNVDFKLSPEICSVRCPLLFSL
jgi:hypothetical protein